MAKAPFAHLLDLLTAVRLTVAIRRQVDDTPINADDATRRIWCRVGLGLRDMQIPDITTPNQFRVTDLPCRIVQGAALEAYNGPKNLDTHSAKVPYSMHMKKTYTAAFKAQLVLELLRETKSINQLAAEHGVAPTMLREWKQAALTGMPDLFERRDSVTELRAAHARELAQLYAEIGRFTTHVNFLKKKLPD